MSLFHMMHVHRLVKSNPYHDALGHFASANSAGGVVKFKHKNYTYSSAHDENGDVTKINWHSKDGKAVPYYDKDSGKKITPAQSEAIQHAKDIHLGYTTKGHLAYVYHDDLPKENSLATDVKPQSGEVKSLGKIGESQGYIVHHEGKQYYASVNSDGDIQKIAEHNPDNPNSNVLYQKGNKSPSGDQVETYFAVKEAALSAHADGTAKPLAVAEKPKASYSSGSSTPPGLTTPPSFVGKNAHITDAEGNPLTVTKNVSPVPAAAKEAYANFKSMDDDQKQKAMYAYGKAAAYANLTSAERDTVDEYKGSTYRAINSHLRDPDN